MTRAYRFSSSRITTLNFFRQIEWPSLARQKVELELCEHKNYSFPAGPERQSKNNESRAKKNGNVKCVFKKIIAFYNGRHLKRRFFVAVCSS